MGNPARSRSASLDDGRDVWDTAEWPRRIWSCAPDFATAEGVVARSSRGSSGHFGGLRVHAIELDRTCTKRSSPHSGPRRPVLCHRPGSRFELREGEYVASLIPVAEVTPLPGEAFRCTWATSRRARGGAGLPPGIDDTDRCSIGSSPPCCSPTSSVRRKRAAELGDLAWKELLGTPRPGPSGRSTAYRGRYVHTTGDGLLATFDGPARAVRCAQAIVGDGPGARLRDPRGLAHRRGRAVGRGHPGDHGAHRRSRRRARRPVGSPRSSTVKDLSPGSGLTFEDAGEHELKGVPDRWHLYRVVS